MVCGADESFRALLPEWLQSSGIAADDPDFLTLGEKLFRDDPARVTCSSGDDDHVRLLYECLLCHWNFYAGLFRETGGFGIARVYVARHANAGIVGQDALDAFAHFFGAVGNCDLAGVQ